jgi:protein-tyrosine phosphatase
MTYMLEKHGREGTAHSAGTSDWNVGSQADRRSIKVGLDRGIDIRAHRARQLRKEDFEEYDAIFVMDGSNEKAVKSVAPKAVHHKIKRIIEPDGDVPDPYHSDESAFRDVFDTLWHQCERLAKET